MKFHIYLTMWNPPSYEELSKLPSVGDYANTPIKDINIHQHYFIGSADWWISEYDSQNRLLYGYACLGDKQMAEWGYASLDEMLALKISPLDTEAHFEIDRDLFWNTRPVSQVEGIVDCYKAQGIENILTQEKILYHT